MLDFTDPKLQALMGASNFLQLDEQSKTQKQTLQQLQKMNDLASKERARLAKLHQELLRTTKPCPHCSGRIPHGYTACMHCTRDVIWAGHFIGKPGEEEKVQLAYKNYENQRRKEERKKALKEKQRRDAQQKQQELQLNIKMKHVAYQKARASLANLVLEQLWQRDPYFATQTHSSPKERLRLEARYARKLSGKGVSNLGCGLLGIIVTLLSVYPVVYCVLGSLQVVDADGFTEAYYAGVLITLFWLGYMIYAVVAAYRSDVNEHEADNNLVREEILKELVERNQLPKLELTPQYIKQHLPFCLKCESESGWNGSDCLKCGFRMRI